MTRTWSKTSSDDEGSYAPPPTVPQSSLLPRRILSLLTIMLLFTAAVPFSPVSWFLGGVVGYGALLFDQFVAGLVLVAGCYFQWAIAGLTHPVVVVIPNPLGGQGSETYISNGRMGTRQKNVGQGGQASEIVFAYHPQRYYVYTLVEMGLLVVAEWSGFEYVRRVIVLGVLAGLWAVGWRVTPQRVKKAAWEWVKGVWFLVVVDLARGVMFEGAGRRRGRR